MRKLLTPLQAILFFCISSLSLSAQTLKDVFTSAETPILYLGIDFTQARFINDASKAGLEIRDKCFSEINDIVSTKPRYDFDKSFRKSVIKHDLGIVTKRNQTTDPATILSTNTNDYIRLNEDDINKLVTGIDFEGKKGLGLLLVADGLKRTGNKARSSIWVTIVDMGANKMLMTERVDGEISGGRDFSNFWALTIYYVVYIIEKDKYKEWKKVYGK